MRTITVAALVASSILPALAAGQSWSPEQQEVIDRIARCNDGWVESMKQKDFAAFDDICPETDDAVFWYTNGEAPIAYGGANGLWSLSAPQVKSISWQDFRPLMVQVDGDVAIAYFSVVWILETVEGQASRNPSRRLTVFRHRNGEWLMAGGSVAAAD